MYQPITFNWVAPDPDSQIASADQQWSDMRTSTLFWTYYDPPGSPTSNQNPAVVATVPLDFGRLTGAQIENSRLWDLEDKYKRYMPVAQAFAAMSKMPGTKVGCIVLGDSFQTLSSGWNGAARGCDADEDERLDTRESRLDWVVHAEANAIAAAAMSGTSLDGSTLICTHMPCMACAKLIAQAGISRVVCPEPGEDMSRWADQFSLTRRLFMECDIDLIEYDTTGSKE